jgi:hypothetical protein
MEHSVGELAYKLWQVRSINNRASTPEENWYDAERILSNQFFKPGIKVLYDDEEYEFLKITEENYVMISSNTKVLSVPIGEVVVIDG